MVVLGVTPTAQGRGLGWVGGGAQSRLCPAWSQREAVLGAHCWQTQTQAAACGGAGHQGCSLWGLQHGEPPWEPRPRTGGWAGVRGSRGQPGLTACGGAVTVMCGPVPMWGAIGAYQAWPEGTGGPGPWASPPQSPGLVCLGGA